MDILGIGFPELIFIFFIALMIFGPRRLPEVAAKAGKIVRDLRGMSQGFMTEWQREVAVAARLNDLQQIRQELKETKQVLQQTQKELSLEAAQVSQTISAAAVIPKTVPTLPAASVSTEAPPEKNGQVPQAEAKPSSAPTEATE